MVITNYYIFTGKSFYILSKDSNFRRQLALFLDNSYFESIIYNLIALNAVILMIDDPIVKSEYTNQTLKLIGNFISAVFIIEFLLKVITMGFFIGKHTYVKDPFNVLDLLVVLISITTFWLELFNN